MRGQHNRRNQTPNEDPGLHPHPRPQQSDAEALGEIVDDARQLLTDAGLRPYRVFSVVTAWDGGEPGRGEERVVSQQELLPTPMLVHRASTRVSPAGKQERGTARLSEVSPRYTEDDVRQLFHRQPLPGGHQGFIEVVMDGRAGASAVRRRYAVTGVPWLDAEDFQWVVQLTLQDGARGRDGVLPATEEYPPRFRGE